MSMSKKANQTRRKKGSDKRKNTFNKYGKNTSRGLRIKQSELEKMSENIKRDGDNNLYKIHKKFDNKGKHRFKRSDNAGMCKSTCRNKKQSKKK
jgi:hypothetical protein